MTQVVAGCIFGGYGTHMTKDDGFTLGAVCRELALWLPMPYNSSVPEAANLAQTRGRAEVYRPVTLWPKVLGMSPLQPSSASGLSTQDGLSVCVRVVT